MEYVQNIQYKYIYMILLWDHNKNIMVIMLAMITFMWNEYHCIFSLHISNIQI